MVQEIIPPSPDPLPGVGNAYRHGWKQLWKNFADLLLAGIVFVVVVLAVGLVIGVIFAVGWRDSIPSTFDLFVGTSMTPFLWHFQVVSGILEAFFYTPLFWGLLFLFLGAAAGRRPDLPELFAGFKHRYPNVLLGAVLWWLIFSLVPFVIGWTTSGFLGSFLSAVWFFVNIVLYSRLVFVPFLLLDKGLPAGEAFARSWEWSRGHALENFLIFVLGVLIILAGLVVFIVGVIPAVMWVATSFASQYEAVRREKENPVVFPSPLVP